MLTVNVITSKKIFKIYLIILIIYFLVLTFKYTCFNYVIDQL